MHLNDGRVVSNFIIQALKGEDITVISLITVIAFVLLDNIVLKQVYGDGDQSRSFQYVSDLVSGLISLMESNVTVPTNLGNPEEYSIRSFANLIRDFVGNDNIEGIFVRKFDAL